MSVRASSYVVSEDVHLCQVYLEISQDPITGRYQSADHFWSRVEKSYNASRNQSWESRSKRSVQCRIQTIMAEVKKLNGCLKQVENLNPSGASDADIFSRAKELFMQDPKFKKGFKFDHVWNIVKDFEKFKDNVPTARKIARNLNYDSPQSDNPTPESPMSSSPGLPSFFPTLDEENFGSTSSQRPIGVKKAKGKRKNDEDLNDIKESNRQLLEMLQNTRSERKELLEIQRQSLAFKAMKEENKVLFKDLNSIADPNVREHFRVEQARILQKRAQQQQQHQGSSSDAFGQFFNDIGGSGTDLPPF